MNLHITPLASFNQGSHALTLAKAFTLLFLLCGQLLFAQDVEYDWAYVIGSTAQAQDRAGSICTDASGNVYTTGSFLGAVDFDPGPDTTSLTASFFDVFVSKTDAAGNLIWAKNFGGGNSDASRAIHTDNAGNVYTIGYFYATADFDPGPGTVNLSSNGSYDIFISKLDTSGNLVWARSIGGSNSDDGYSIHTDDAGNVYTTGSFSGTVDFDPGPGTTDLTSNSSQQLFISKLDASGNFVWVRTIDGTLSSQGKSIFVDTSGNPHITGYFSGTADFDPGAGTVNLTSNGNRDAFISKLDPSGNLIWAKSMGGSSNDIGQAVHVTPTGETYLAGDFNGTADFDPNAGTTTLSSSGEEDIFISKLDASGNLLWANNIGGANSDIVNDLSIDQYGNVYTTGKFEGTADFDPGSGTSELTSLSSVYYNAFISKLNSAGDFVWVKSIEAANGSEALGVDADGFGNVYTTGDFKDTADFNPGIGVNELYVNGATDIFVLKLKCSATFGTVTIAACDSYAFNGVTYTSDNNTATDTLINAVGCDSIVTLDLTITTVDVSTTQNEDTLLSNAAGASYQWIDCSDNSFIAGATDSIYIAMVSGDYAVIVTEGNCADTSSCMNAVIITDTVGIIDLNHSKNIHLIYPNPAKDEVRISNYQSSIDNVSILDLTGKLILSFEPKSELLDLSLLNAGVYFIKIQQGEDVMVQKLLKE